MEGKDLRIGELAEGELLLELFVKADGNALLVLFSNLFGVVEDRDAVTEFKCEKQGVSDLVSNVGSTEVID